LVRLLVLPHQHRPFSILSVGYIYAKREDALYVNLFIGSTVTVEKVAINAVMAGCGPEHLPILLAAVAASDGRGGSIGGNTTGMVWIVSGPIAKEVGMAGGVQLMSPWNYSNNCLGRAYWFCQKNFGIES
jgi:hypothetical protein